MIRLFLVMSLMTATPWAFAGGGGPIGEEFLKTIYVSSVGKTANNGASYSAAKPCQVGTGALSSGTTSADLWDIPAGVLIKKAYLIVDTAIASTTNLDIGDDDDPDGYVDGSVSVTLGSEGLYGYSSKVAGLYLQATSNNASVDNGKYYSATGKEIKMAYTAGGCSAGRFRVVLEGVYLGTK